VDGRGERKQERKKGGVGRQRTGFLTNCEKKNDACHEERKHIIERIGEKKRGEAEGKEVKKKAKFLEREK